MWKRCPTSLVIREIQIETTVIHHMISTRMAATENQITNSGKEVEKLEFSHAAGREVKWYICFRKQFVSSSHS